MLGMACTASHAAPPDTIRIRKLLNEAIDSLEYNLAFSGRKAEEALGLSRSSNYTHGTLVSMNLIGYVKLHSGDEKGGLVLLQQVLQMAGHKHRHECQSTLLQLGLYHKERGNYATALNFYQQALALSRSRHSTFYTASSAGDIGQLYITLGSFDKAAYYTKYALGLHRELHDTDGMINGYATLATIDNSQGRYKEGMDNIRKAFDLSKHSPNIAPDLRTTLYANLANCYSNNNNTDSAIICHTKALALSRELGNKQTEFDILLSLGATLEQTGKVRDAIAHFKAARKLAEEAQNYGDLRLAAGDLAFSYARIHSFKDAFLALETAYLATDSFLSQEKIRAVTDIAARYETQELALKNAQLQRKVQRQKYIMIRNWFIAAGIVTLALILLLIAFFKSRQNRLRARMLGMELEQQQYRSRMNPHFIFNCLNSIQHYIVYKDVRSANKYLSEFAALMRQTLETNARQTIPLKSEMDYLRHYLTLEQMRLDHTFEFDIHYTEDTDIERLEIPAMILQPFVENAVQHGLRPLTQRSGQLNIRFSRAGKSLLCEIEDNGVGRRKIIQPDNGFATHVSQGIALVRKRLENLRTAYNAIYSLVITDKTDAGDQPAGTVVSITLPYSV